MENIAKLLIGIGLFCLFSGVLLLLLQRFFPGLGNLPGDLTHEGDNVKIYAPFTTMIIVSIVGTIILNVIIRFFK